MNDPSVKVVTVWMSLITVVFLGATAYLLLSTQPKDVKAALEQHVSVLMHEVLELREEVTEVRLEVDQLKQQIIKVKE